VSSYFIKYLKQPIIVETHAHHNIILHDDKIGKSKIFDMDLKNKIHINVV